MNNTNPFVTQGSLLEQKNKKRARVKVAVFTIFAVNLLVISPLLIQGCSKKNTDDNQAGNVPTDTNMTSLPDTNTTTNLPPVGNTVPPTLASNPVVPVPPVPVPPTPTPTPEAHEYTIIKGDTYYSIGKKFGLKMSEIKAANPGVNPNKLKAGNKIQLPAGGAGSSTGTTTGTDAGADVYVVKPGDSLGKIAKANGTTVKELKAANGLKSDRIKAGDKLKLPAKTVPATSVPPVPDATTTPATGTPPPLTNPGAPATSTTPLK